MDQARLTPARRGRSTAAQVAQLRATYLAAPQSCLQCGKPILPHEGEKIHETMRRKFCSRSCAASYNNSSAVAPKKKAKPRYCAACGGQVATSMPEGTRILCASCEEHSWRGLPSLRRAEASSAEIRRHTRHVLAGRPRLCAQCGYARHVETVRLRPIDDFPPDATLATIDAPANLAYLCPNHRWEYEHGFLTLDSIAAITPDQAIMADQAAAIALDPTAVASRPDMSRPAPLHTSRKRPLYASAVASR